MNLSYLLHENKPRFINRPGRRFTLNSILLVSLFSVPIHAQSSVGLTSPSANENINTANPIFVWEDRSDAAQFQILVRDVAAGVTYRDTVTRTAACNGATRSASLPDLNLQFSKKSLLESKSACWGEMAGLERP